MRKIYPAFRFNGFEMVVDEARREVRVPRNPASGRPFATDDELTEYVHWTKLLQKIVGKRVVYADMLNEEYVGCEGMTPVLTFDNGLTLWMVADEEGNGPGRFEIRDAKEELAKSESESGRS